MKIRSRILLQQSKKRSDVEKRLGIRDGESVVLKDGSKPV